MILKGSQRKWGKRLAQHLLNDKENDQVELGEIRALAAQSVLGAFLEIEATARGTRCQEPFYSCSFNPPENASCSVDQFERAFDAVERKLRLEGQPRVVIWHEKLGRRHAHCVWSRIDVDKNRAIQLSFDRPKLREVSRQLFHELGIEPPAGIADRAKRDPRNYDRAIAMQAKRLLEDPRKVKALIRDAFLRSDSRAAFERALAPHALYLAKGDRRPYVILHGPTGEILSLPSYSGLKTKQLRDRLGPERDLASIEDVRARLREPDRAALRRQIQEAKARHQNQLKAIRAEIDVMKIRHRQDRARFLDRQQQEWQAGERQRADRLRKGLIGVFDRLTGTRSAIAGQNVAERAAQKAVHRERKQGLIDHQLEERRALQRSLEAARERQQTERQTLRDELGVAAPPLRETFTEAAAPQMGDPGYAEWREAQREITRDRRSRGENGRDRGREPG